MMKPGNLISPPALASLLHIILLKTMNLKRHLFAVAPILLSFHLQAAASCSPATLNLQAQSTAAEHAFYTGTCHFRNQEYTQAAKQWEKLIEMKDDKPETFKLQLSARNNLAFMLFMGKHTKADKEKAISYWRQASAAGHAESEYHLCHVYGDKKEPSFNRKLAATHCEKAKLIYQGMQSRVGDDELILKQINHFLSLASE